MKELLAQGAEAKTYRDGKFVFKERFEKSYRHKELDDALRFSRTKREQSVLEKLSLAGIPVPKVFTSEDPCVVHMGFVDAPRLRDVLLATPQQVNLIELAAKLLAQMHNLGIIHGDYTTSNILVRNASPADLVIIDFGLTFFSQKIEDMAVDIHLAFQAFESTHYVQAKEYENIFLEVYQNECDQGENILKRLEIVQLRGRNKH